jgi:hypothetical protein
MSSLHTDALSDAELDAAQRVADGEIESIPDASAEAPEAPPAAESKDPAADSPEAAAGDPEPVPVAPAPVSKPAGVSSKDGSRVLPYAALQGSRRETQHERAARMAAERERDELRQQLEDLKAGKTTPADQLDELVIDFPQTEVLVTRLRTAEDELAELRKGAAPVSEPAAVDDEPTQILEAIDSVPLLSQWFHADRALFDRAAAFDVVLQTSPKWASRPLAERFAKASRMVAEELDLQVSEEDIPSFGAAQAPAKPPPPPPAAQAAAVIRNAPRVAPNTLSDFKGGAAPRPDNVDGLSPSRQRDRFAGMSDEQISAYLRSVG